MLLAGSTLPLRPQALDGTEVRSLGPERWARDLRSIRNGGFAHVDLLDTWLPFHDFTSGELADFRAVLDDVGLQPVGISLVRRSVIDPVDHATNLAATLHALEAAAALGVGLVSMGFHRPLTERQRQRWPFWMVDQPADDRSDDNFRFAAAQVQTVADAAAALGLQISLELYEFTLIDRAQGITDLLELVDRANVGINADIGNLVRVPSPDVEPWDVTFAACLPHLNFWHAKNVVRLVHPDTDVILTQPTPLHTGVVDYRRAVEMAAASGFGGAICIEHYGDDGLAVQEIGRAYLERVFEDLEVLT